MVYFPSEIVDIIMSHVGPEDFYTLFQCALVNRQWSRAALRALYRAEGLFPGVHRASAYEHSKISIRPLTWANFWWTLIVSAFTFETYLPYAALLCTLDLCDLALLIHLDKDFADKLRYGRFAFELKIIRLENYCNICAAVGWDTWDNEEERDRYLGVSSSVLDGWAPRLIRLQTLWYNMGKHLHVDNARSIARYCPRFKNLIVWEWMEFTISSARFVDDDSDSETDEEETSAGDFLMALRRNTLERFEISRDSHFKPSMVQGLVAHSQSMRVLKLPKFRSELVVELLKSNPLQSLEAVHFFLGYEKRAEIAQPFGQWLGACQNLRRIETWLYHDELLMLANALQHPIPSLEVLIVQQNYEDDPRIIDAFYRGVSRQRSLQELTLNTEMTSNKSVFMWCLFHLKKLRKLNLRRVSSQLTLPDIGTLTSNFPDLTWLGLCVTPVVDEIWDYIVAPKLRYLHLVGIGVLHAQPVLDFIHRLGEQNRGFTLKLKFSTFAELYTTVSDEDHRAIAYALFSHLDGRLLPYREML
ncbi:hypothetical protein CNMCM8812_004445 [Aspergillus fumigatus]|nr:hypothetical protein CNMCM8057_004666 [Aspergillus fumigatus]KAF4262705.1 hypothetical protein CNMCM8812_004445 [Aspergillus fumigatus]KAH1295641.1 hypothetical protein KXX11_008289 [Aspergillus fumigatus]KAH1614058.1 hypothetical protein KXX21_001618 [Aspergillus fumigatus]KAH1672977.1 hypothetical protein KXX15_000843 [Aspergillus fumigatus]